MAALPGRRAAPEHGAHARRQLAQTEWLRHVIVGAEIEAGDAGVLGRACREHDDRHLPSLGASSQDAAHFGAAQDRQIEVEDDQIGRLRRDRLQRIVATAHDLGIGFAAALEGVLDQARNVAIVFDDEDAVSGHLRMSAATEDTDGVRQSPVPHAGRRPPRESVASVAARQVGD